MKIETRSDVPTATPLTTSNALVIDSFDKSAETLQNDSRITQQLSPVDEETIPELVSFSEPTGNPPDLDTSHKVDMDRIGYVRARDDQYFRQKLNGICLAILDSTITYIILKMVLIRAGPIAPFYQKGMRYGGFMSPRNEVVLQENINLDLLRVSKDFYNVCREIFYGGNYFMFVEPFACDWWMKHISQESFSRVRHLHLDMRCGWLPIRGDRWNKGKNKSHYDRVQYFRTSEAEKWFEVICWMQHRHNLVSLQLGFNSWRSDLDTANLPHEAQDEIHKFRNKIILKLKLFRGIEIPTIRRDDDHYLHPSTKNEIELLMKQPKSNEPHRDMRKTSVWEALEMVQAENEAKEMEAQFKAYSQITFQSQGQNYGGRRVRFT